MELKEFIEKVLVDINEAVNEAGNKTKRKIEIYGSPENRHIEFDIAVSIESGSTRTGKGGVKVLEVIEARGKASIENKNSIVSRIKFGVFVSNYEIKKSTQ